MKKRLTAVLLTAAVLLFAAGCSAAGAIDRLDAAEDRVEDKLDAVEDAVENAVRQTIAPAPTKSAPAVPASPESAPTESRESTIPREEAERIALEYAGFTADQISRLHTEFEIDDGTRQYDVQFLEGDWEYEFEISADDGRILSFDKDHKYD